MRLRLRLRLSRLAILAALAACGHPGPIPNTPLPPLGSDAAAPPAGLVAVDAKHVEAQLTPYIASIGAKLGEPRRFSGFVLIAQQGKPIYQHAFGFADREHQVPADADTSFRIGSVTKQFTAAAIMVLAQDGKLSVDDPIRKYLPDYPEVGRDITLHQLLTHTSGLPDYTEQPGFLPGIAHTPAELLAIVDEQPLAFEPGSQYAYSNTNYVVLGAIIEKVSGQTYADFLQKRLFAPAGLTRTVVGDADGMPDRAIGYEPSGSTLAPAPPLDMSNPFAAGAVRSTAADLVRWAHALDGDAILTAASKARMYTPEKEDYAYGWIIKDDGGHKLILHNGEINGFRTIYVRLPEQDLVVVAWTNNVAFDPDPLGKAAIDVALGGDLAPVVEPDVVPLDDAAAARIVGHYKLTDDARAAAVKAGVTADILATITSLDVGRDGDHLVVKPVGQPPFAVDALAADRYVMIDAHIEIAVTLPAQGNASAVTLTQGPLALSYTRDDPAAPPPPRPKNKHR